jgi:serine phosphatase RsbU (regulator of sigma subunit)
MRSDGSEFPVELAITRVHAEGEPFFAGFIRDITDRKRVEDQLRRAEEGQRFLAEASEALSESLAYEDTLAKVARLAVPRLADWCAVSIKEQDGTVNDLAVTHVDPRKVDLAKELRLRYPPDPSAPSGVHEVIRTGEPQLFREISPSMVEGTARDDEHKRLLRELQLRSAIIAPMLVRGRTLGAITFIFAESGRRYDEHDLELAQDLARRAALAVENARLFEERSYVAQTLQQSLLPHKLPSVPGVELSSLYKPAGEMFDVGGDFYDVFPSSARSWAFVIGDVCGKGPDAAAVTGLARHTIRAAAAVERKPSRILSALNDAVMQQRSDHTFCTVSYVRLQPRADRADLAVCCGGHPLPLVLRSDGTVEACGTEGTLLGIFPDPLLVDRPASLRPGDALILYTDGLTDRQSAGGRVGAEGLVELVASCAGQDAAGIAATIDRAVSDEAESPQDDVAVLVVRLSDNHRVEGE